MGRFRNFCKLVLLLSLFLSGCLFCWTEFSLRDRSVIRQIWKEYTANTNVKDVFKNYYSRINTTEQQTRRNDEIILQEEPSTSIQIFTTTNQHTVTGGKTQATSCTPQKNIAFMKTHKCGSSTMQNIIMRYGDTRNLTFALPKIGNYAYDHMFTMLKPLRKEYVQELPVSRYNILCHHCIFNASAFKDIVYDGALIMTVIRSPVRVFESTFSYFGWAKHLNLLNYTNPLLEFMNRAEKSSNHKYTSKRNPMLHSFGLLNRTTNEATINSFIDHLKSAIDFVVITDHFDESLILLKDKLCWDFDDIVYFPQLVRHDRNRNNIDGNLAERVKRWNFGDAKLFEYFNQSLWRRIEEFGRDRMRKELEKFRERKQFWKDKCTEGDNISRFFIALKTKPGLGMGSECWQMTRSEIFYTRYIRGKQVESFNITEK
ncbi:galactosylceramide sulfotransferase-like [Anneissia japonica]|uniref:galactosylceramide sulfotransferase-like n=1 Tax=Anneissia japonica TaxID=1529436 RepID=UPI001425946B|nr:galactosylceramide sulfotransferase-like [Anneissia japonica]XP_033101945.1 galactosylceramide sulfotransferase-like [Anneissia japonica]